MKTIVFSRRFRIYICVEFLRDRTENTAKKASAAQISHGAS